MGGRCRFGKYVKNYFRSFLKKRKELGNEDWENYFQDKGKNKQVPLDYLVEIENGLSRFALDRHAMGTGTL